MIDAYVTTANALGVKGTEMDLGQIMNVVCAAVLVDAFTITNHQLQNRSGMLEGGKERGLPRDENQVPMNTISLLHHSARTGKLDDFLRISGNYRVK